MPKQSAKSRDLAYFKKLLEKTSQNIKEISSYFDGESKTEPHKAVVKRKTKKEEPRSSILSSAKEEPTKVQSLKPSNIGSKQPSNRGENLRERYLKLLNFSLLPEMDAAISNMNRLEKIKKQEEIKVKRKVTFVNEQK